MAEILVEEVAEATDLPANQTTRRNERGMTTAEYAMGIIAACTLMGVLIVVFSNPAFRELMTQLISELMRHFLHAPR